MGEEAIARDCVERGLQPKEDGFARGHAFHGPLRSRRPEVGFVDPLYAYYDSKLLKRRSPHIPLDRVEKEIAEYQKLGVRILGVYPPTLQGEVYELHPEWRRVPTDTDEIPSVDLKKNPVGGMLCPLGPYGDFFIDVLAEIVTKFPAVSAFSCGTRLDATVKGSLSIGLRDGLPKGTSALPLRL